MTGPRNEAGFSKASVRAAALEMASEPASVVEVVHPGFNSDAESGGFAFVTDRGLVIHDAAGGRSWTVDPGDDEGRAAAVSARWDEVRHRNRTLSLAEINEWHQAAIAALTKGLDSVAELPPELQPADVGIGDYVLVFLRRFAKEPTEAAVLRALAENDWLLELPTARTSAHPCPVCGRPAIGEAWQYVSVCDTCYPKAACSHGRRVSGYNTSFSGGFEAQHVDDESVCDQVSEDGAVDVDGLACTMGEAKFGGVFVGR